MTPRDPFVPPFKVHICWFENPATDPRCAAIASELYEFLHRPLNDDVVLRPGIEIPVEYGRNLADLLEALPACAGAACTDQACREHDRIEPARVRLVIVLVDAAAFVNNH